jgi:hypothetical protein
MSWGGGVGRQDLPTVTAGSPCFSSSSQDIIVLGWLVLRGRGPRFKSSRAHHSSRCTRLNEIALVLCFQGFWNLYGLYPTALGYSPRAIVHVRFECSLPSFRKDRVVDSSDSNTNLRHDRAFRPSSNMDLGVGLVNQGITVIAISPGWTEESVYGRPGLDRPHGTGLTERWSRGSRGGTPPG